MQYQTTIGANGDRMMKAGTSGCTCSLARDVLERLFDHWPLPSDLSPEDFGLADEEHGNRFTQLMQSLLDQGFVTYEKAARSDAPRFRDTLITPSGRTALRVMRFLATLP